MFLVSCAFSLSTTLDAIDSTKHMFNARSHLEYICNLVSERTETPSGRKGIPDVYVHIIKSVWLSLPECRASSLTLLNCESGNWMPYKSFPLSPNQIDVMLPLLPCILESLPLTLVSSSRISMFEFSSLTVYFLNGSHFCRSHTKGIIHCLIWKLEQMKFKELGWGFITNDLTNAKFPAIDVHRFITSSCSAEW